MNNPSASLACRTVAVTLLSVLLTHVAPIKAEQSLFEDRFECRNLYVVSTPSFAVPFQASDPAYEGVTPHVISCLAPDQALILAAPIEVEGRAFDQWQGCDDEVEGNCVINEVPESRTLVMSFQTPSGCPVCSAISLAAAPTSIDSGESISLLWAAAGVADCERVSNPPLPAWSGPLPAGNQVEINPTAPAGQSVTYDFSIACAEEAVSNTVSVTVQGAASPPVAISAFNFRVNSGTTQPAQNLTVDEGANLRISWSTTNADSCTALGTLAGWAGASLAANGSRDIAIGPSGGTVQLRCTNAATEMAAQTQTFQINVAPAGVPPECGLQHPGFWTRQTDCIFNEPFRDCTQWESVFAGWPGTSAARNFFLSQNQYVAMEFVPPVSTPENFQIQINFNEPQFGIPSTGTKIVTISPCPGDFDRASVTKKMGTDHCYLKQSFPGQAFLIGGPDSPGSFRCKFEPDGQRLYLNIVYSADPAGTAPAELQWGCGGASQCANRVNIIAVQ
ncbi:MAG: hypothetical protein JJU31_13030 [Wenzhouxiangella sp.]|nr:hypothetical protein [Wenzhouxiangella sp.]